MHLGCFQLHLPSAQNQNPGASDVFQAGAGEHAAWRGDAPLGMAKQHSCLSARFARGDVAPGGVTPCTYPHDQLVLGWLSFQRSTVLSPAIPTELGSDPGDDQPSHRDISVTVQRPDNCEDSFPLLEYPAQWHSHGNSSRAEQFCYLYDPLEHVYQRPQCGCKDGE